MDPRLKLYLELAFYTMAFIGGTMWISDALNGGPVWKFLGVLVCIMVTGRFSERWNRL